MFQIITDACCDIPAALLEASNVHYIPMMLELDNQEYMDDLGKTFRYEWFLEQLQENKQPSTSQINVGRYAEVFRPYVEQAIPILYIGFSSGMSGSYNSSIQAVSLLKEEFPHAEIHCVDTKGASLGEGLLVMQAVELKSNGSSLLEIVEWLELNKDYVRSWVTANDLKHLERGGRISKTAATIGGLLHVKPIIIVDEDGKLKNIDKVRGRNKAIQKIVNETIQSVNVSVVSNIYIAHSGDEQAAQKAEEQLAEKLPQAKILRFSLGPTIASHTGYGCIAIFSIGQSKR